MMKGRMWVESEMGHGSTFHFTICLGLQRDPKYSPSEVIDIALEGVRALVVDDNATNRRILAEMLHSWGIVPTVVGSGEEALAIMNDETSPEGRFSLALIDGIMGGMNGFDLAERIKKNPRLAETNIIMLTSAGYRGDAARCNKIGISTYLLKPVKQSDLFDAIVTSLSKKRVGRPAESAVTRHTLPENRQSLNILLAEDNRINQKLAVNLLKKRGHRVSVANNGEEVLKALERNKFDVILMDVQMPRMDGFEATRTIRTREEGTDERIPIIAMTAHAMKGDRDRCLAAGMDQYISKPINMNQLYETVESAVPLVKNRSHEVVSLLDMSEGIDKTRLLHQVDGDEALLDELVEIFVSDSPSTLKEIRTAIEQRDAELLRISAHSLKGAIGNFAAEKAFQAAMKLESIGRAGRWIAPVKRSTDSSRRWICCSQV